MFPHHVLLLGDEDDGAMVVGGCGVPEGVVAEGRDSLSTEAPEEDLLLAEGEKALVLIEKDEGEGRRESLGGDRDELRGEQVDDLEGRVVLLEQQLLVELLDHHDGLAALHQLLELAQELARLDRQHLERNIYKYVYMYTYTYVYIHICIYIYIHIYIYMNIYINIHMYMYVYKYIYVYVHIHTYTHTYI